jgi:hypothetical protein
LEEIDREQEAVRATSNTRSSAAAAAARAAGAADALARDLQPDVDAEEFVGRAESLVSQYPELQALTWIDERRRIKASYAAPSVHPAQQRSIGDVLRPGETESQLRAGARPAAAGVLAAGGRRRPSGLLQLHVPLADQGKFAGVILGEYSIDSLLRYGVPPEVSARYAVSLLDGKGRVLAGSHCRRGPGARAAALGDAQANEYEVPVSPVGNGLVLRAQAYRTSLGVVGSGLFWLVGALSAMTAGC